MDTELDEKTEFKFDELSDSAKARALDWYREGQSQDWDGEYTIADCKTCLGFLGFEVDTNTRANSKGVTYTLPAIYYQISWSQGDGAVFEASWKAEDVDMAALADHAPIDTDLRNWAAQLMVIRLRYPDATARVKTRPTGPGLDHMFVDDVDTQTDRDAPTYDEWMEEQLKEIADHLAHWIYTQLRNELEYQTSDEVCEEGITSGEYKFDEDGGVI